MGGLGSGRKAAHAGKPQEPDKLEPGEIIGDAGNSTIIETPEPKKSRTQRPAKGVAVNAAEARQKINLLFSGLARLTGREYTYEETDFEAEAQAVVRLSQKFNMVSYVLTLLDPVFMALGLLQKFMKLPAREKQKQAQQGQPPTPGQVVNFQR